MRGSRILKITYGLPQQQNQSRASRIIGTPASSRRSLIQFHTFRFRQYDRGFHAHDQTIVSVVTVH